jgi:hypothetical protein
MENIIWKDCYGFENHYEVSNFGNVRRKQVETNYKDGRVANFKQTILKPSKDKKGYLRVYLSVNSKKHAKKIHRLVALTFLENPLNKETVNHKDLDKENNNIKNLEWMTNKENMQHAFKNGVYKERDKYTIKNLGKYAGF